jgi:hypothetical protein
VESLWKACGGVWDQGLRGFIEPSLLFLQAPFASPFSGIACHCAALCGDEKFSRAVIPLGLSVGLVSSRPFIVELSGASNPILPGLLVAEPNERLAARHTMPFHNPLSRSFFDSTKSRPHLRTHHQKYGDDTRTAAAAAWEQTRP